MVGIKFRRYSDFTLAKVKKFFNLTTSEDTDIFAAVPELEASEYLKEILQYNVPGEFYNSGIAKGRRFVTSM